MSSDDSVLQSLKHGREIIKEKYRQQTDDLNRHTTRSAHHQRRQAAKEASLHQCSHALVVFDGRVQDVELLEAALLLGNSSLIIPESELNALATISDQIAVTGATRLAIVAHGKPGLIELGAVPLTLAKLEEQAIVLAEWGVAEIALYACEVGADVAFVHGLAQLTRAEVAAATGKVGAAALGGSWHLSNTNTSPFALELLAEYAGVLATFTGTSGDDEADSSTGDITGFTGGTPAELQDGVGDTFNGLEGNDTVVAGSGNDQINGGADNDVLNPGTGDSDNVDGGTGTDTLIVNYSSNDNPGNPESAATQGIRYFGFDSAKGNGGFLAYKGGNNTSLDRVDYSKIEKFNITGTKYTDDIRGGDNNDTLIGGDGNDTLSGFRGVDSLDGGSGNDLASIDLSDSSNTNSVNIIASTTNYGTTINSIEALNATGGTGKDTFVGGGLSDNLTGGAGNDVLNAGTGGSDNIDGGEGTDTLIVNYSSNDNPGNPESAATKGIRYFGFDSANGNGGFLAYKGGNNTSLDRVDYSKIEKFNITGTKYTDDIRGGDNNDTLIGGVGNDTLSGFRGVDSLDGGTGNDLASIDLSDSTKNNSVNIIASTTNYGTTINSIEALNASGGTGKDTFVGGGLSDNLTGGAGDDVLNAGTGGSDNIDGGEGTDTLIVNYSSNDNPGNPESAATQGIRYFGFDNANGNGGFLAYKGGNNTSLDRVDYSKIERFNITGTKYTDDIRGGDNNDTLIGGVGNDTLSGFRGVDSLDGGTGNDLASIDLSDSTKNNSVNIIASTTNYGTKIRSIEALNASGGTGKDTFVGGGLSDSLTGGAGDDVLNAGNGGSDNIDGGAGTDTLIVNYSANDNPGNPQTAATQGIRYFSFDKINGIGGFIAYKGGNNASNDRIDYSGIERFNLTGTKYNDDIRGGDSADSLVGGDGNDTLSGFAGIDILDGGTGNDLASIDLSESTNNNSVNIIASTTNYGSTIRSIEALISSGGTGNDTFVGGGLSDSLTGGAGNDVLNAGTGGSDGVDGGTGTDTLIVNYSDNDNPGNPEAAATQGIKYFSFDYVNGIGGFIAYKGGNNASNDRIDYSGIERFNITGTKYGDDIRGGISNDSLVGGDGSDTLQGLAGNDILIGANALTIPGTPGIDILTGGAGRDTFILGTDGVEFYDDRDGATSGSDGYALITDFDARQDSIQLASSTSSYSLTANSTINGVTGTAVYLTKTGSEPQELVALIQGEISATGLPQGSGGSNKGEVTFTVSGSSLTPTDTISLVDANGDERTASKTYWVDNTQAWATFDLSGLATGQYDIKVKNGDTVTSNFKQAFSVNDGPIGKLGAAVIATSLEGDKDFPGVIRLTYGNFGQTDVIAPLLRITATNAVIDYGPTNTSSTTLLQLQHLIIGTAENGPAGILSPGSRQENFYTYKALTNGPVKFSVEQVNPLEVINWGKIKTETRADYRHIDATAWDTIWDNFTAKVGSTVGDFQAVIARDASRFSELGLRLDDVGGLFSYEFSKAANGISDPILTSSTDAFDAAPGVSLIFGRSFYQTTAERYNLGIFGRGWSSGWESHLTRDKQGNVSIRSTGDIQRFFARQSDGTFSRLSDGTQLTLIGGNFRLQAIDGGITIYGSDGKLKSLTDTNGNRITLQYSGNLLSKLVHSNGDSFSLSYNDLGRVSEIIDSNSNRVKYSYDAGGEHLQSVTDSTGSVSYTYDNGANANKKHSLLSITSDLGYQSNFEYDSLGRLEKTYGNDPSTFNTYTYDEYGGLTSTNGNGISGSVLPNWDGSIGQIRGEDNLNGLFKYDDQGNLISLTTPNSSAIGSSILGIGGGGFTEYEYDSTNNLTEQTSSSGQTTNLAYDPNFNGLAKFTDTAGNGVAYKYNIKGNVISATYADGSSEKFTLDALGNVLSAINRRGSTIDFSYNKDGLITQKKVANGNQIDYTYDVNGNLTSATDANGTTSLEYDKADRLTKVTDSNGRWLQYTYSVDGQRTSILTQDGHRTNYSYDGLGRLKSLTDGAGKRIISYDYDAVGRLIKETNGNGTRSVYTYDSFNQLTSLVHYKAGSTVNSRYEYVYNELGQRISMTTTDGTFRYGYDDIGQLTSVVTPDNRTIQYLYDEAGNRASVIDNDDTISYASNNLNQYTTAGNEIFKYDRDGNLISKTSNGQTSTLSYDAENRLTQVLSPSGTWIYEYDALGNRVATTFNGQRTEYLIDPTGLGDIVGEYNTAGLVAHYDYGAGLVSRVGTSVNYYDEDGTGSTIGLSRADGTYVNRYSYLPFGESLSKVEAVANPFEYVGQFGVTEEGNGLNFMRARFYDPALGRFTNADPIGLDGGDPNFYRYVRNDSVSSIDPSGEKGGPWETVVNWAWKAKDSKDTYDDAKGKWDGADDPIGLAADKIPGGATYRKVVEATYKGGKRVVESGRNPEILDNQEDLDKYKLPELPDFKIPVIRKTLDNVPGKIIKKVKYFPEIANDIYKKLPKPAPKPRINDITFQDEYLRTRLNENKYRINLYRNKHPRKPGPNGGTSKGDPHLSTLDGTYYDFQGVGEYTLVKSTIDDFEVQTRQEGSGATLNTAIAIRSGSSRISYYVNAPGIIRIDGVATEILEGGLAVGGNIITRNGTTYTINTLNGDIISFSSNSSYLDVTVTLDEAREGSVVGLLGNFNGDSKDDFSLRDGTPIGGTITNAQLYGVFNDSWRITQATSLFDYRANQSTATFNKPTNPATVPTSSTLTPAQRAAAEQVARNAGITDPQLLEDAILDLFITKNDPNLIKGYQVLQKEATANAPNTLINPSSFGPESWIATGTPIPFNIRFANQNAFGTTPIAKVSITQQLDKDLDLSSFSFAEISFGDTLIPIPFGLQSFLTRVDLRSTQGVFVDIDAALNPNTGVITWTLAAIDPLTNTPVDSNTKGFLLPNDANGVGFGLVSYSIKPNSDIPSGTRINSQANISFNNLAPVTTDAVFVTLDTDAPQSSVVSLPASTSNPSFTVTWAGTDASSGVAFFDVFVSVDGNPFTIWKSGTSRTTDTYTGQPGSTYRFYSIATDNAKLSEFAPVKADAVTKVLGNNTPPTVSTISKNGTEDTILTFAASDFTAAFTDPESDSLTKINITSLPSNGQLQLAGVAVSLNQEIPISGLGSLTFVPTANFNGDVSFGWNGSDGSLYATSGSTVSLRIAQVADTFNSSTTTTLPADIENLTLTGSGNINGTGNSLANIITGNSGNNVLNGKAGNDTIIGNAGNDRLTGDSGSDSLVGGNGNDTYLFDADSGLGTDILTDSSGINSLNFSSTTTKVISFNLGNTRSPQIVNSNLSLRLSAGTNVQNLLGGKLDDSLTGSNGNNLLSGNAGNDRLTDLAGNDTLNGGKGNDTMKGGAGNDVYFVDKAGDQVVETSTLKSEIDAVNSSISYVLGDNLESLTLLGRRAISGTGNKLNNLITGNRVKNTLIGDAGNDTLIGGIGSDTLIGSNGNDVLTGGVGSDRFVFDSNAVFSRTSLGLDKITDFARPVDKDKIVLDKATFTALSSIAGTGFSFGSEYAAVSSDSFAATSSAFIVYSRATGNLFYNSNASAAGFGSFATDGGLFATFTGNPALVSSDFMIRS